MQQCLRLVYHRRSNKEIALLLSQAGRPISDGTVGGYIAEAIKVLGARDRRDAAEQLHAFESDPIDLQGAENGAALLTPPASDGPKPIPFSWRGSAPFRSIGVRDNDLSAVQRALWAPAIAFACAIAFGMLAAGLHVISELLRH